MIFNLTSFYDESKDIDLKSSANKPQTFDKEIAIAIMFLGLVVTCVIIIYASVLCKLLISRTKEVKKKLTSSNISENSSILKKDSIIDHELAIDALKKKPSKSILVVSNRQSGPVDISTLFDNQDISSLNGFENERDGFSVYEGDQVSNRKSTVSFKSVTFNEKTQIRRIKSKKKCKKHM